MTNTRNKTFALRETIHILLEYYRDKGEKYSEAVTNALLLRLVVSDPEKTLQEVEQYFESKREPELYREILGALHDLVP